MDKFARRVLEALRCLGVELKFKTRKIHFSKVAFRGAIFEGDISHMANLREGQEVEFTVNPVSASGGPGDYEKGSADWTSSDPSVVVTPNVDNELVAKAKCVDGSVLKAVSVSCHLDGDPDADQVRDILASGTVNVLHGEAVGATMTEGTVVDSEPTA